MCSVLRCSNPSTHTIDVLDEPGAPRFEAPLCDEHFVRIEQGERWTWVEEERCILMGADLDSGGQFVPKSWSFIETIGSSELVVECETPAGRPHEPIRFMMSDGDVRQMLRGFLMRFPLSGGDD